MGRKIIITVKSGITPWIMAKWMTGFFKDALDEAGFAYADPTKNKNSRRRGVSGGT